MGIRSVLRHIKRSLSGGGLAVALFAGSAMAECDRGTVTLRGSWGETSFRVELAETVAAQRRGLMFRNSMPASAGMLFIYPRPQPAVFWMKNTLIPLDMIFADMTGTVTHVHSHARPRDLTHIFGGDRVMAVLEVNAGLAETFGISEGTELQHPGLPQSVAAWPCMR